MYKLICATVASVGLVTSASSAFAAEDAYWKEPFKNVKLDK